MSDDADDTRYQAEKYEVATARYRAYSNCLAAVNDPVFRQFVDKRLAIAASKGMGAELKEAVIAMRGYCRLMGYKLR